MPRTTHELLVCDGCGYLPRACRCYGDSTTHGKIDRSYRREKVLTNPAVAELVEIVLLGVERVGLPNVRRAIRQGALADAISAEDLRVLRRALLVDEEERARSGRHSR